MAQAMVDSGEWTRAIADASPLKHVLVSALGSPEVDPQVRSLDLEREDVMLLCTDGLTKHVSDEEIREHSDSRRSVRVGLPIADRPRPLPWGSGQRDRRDGKGADCLTRSLWCVACKAATPPSHSRA